MARKITVLMVALAARATIGFSPSCSLASTGFVENRGQVDPQVLYYTCGPRAGVFLTKEAIVLDIHKSGTGDRPEVEPLFGMQRRGPRDMFGGLGGITAFDDYRRYEPWLGPEGMDEGVSGARGCAVWIWFEGSDMSPLIEAEGELPTRYNFFLGNDPERWLSDVASFREVVYRDLWPGVDLAMKFEGGVLSFVPSIAPEVDPDRVRFGYEGAEEVVEYSDGSVLLETSAGDITILRSGVVRLDASHRPSDVVDHPDDGVEGQGETSNPSALVWSTFLGGASYEGGYAISADPSGNPVVAGGTGSADFPITPGAYDESFNGWGDVVVTQLDSTGSSILWSTFLGGSGADRAYALSLDPSGDIVATGYAESSDFPTTPGAYDESFNGLDDVFVAKLSSTGDTLIWSTLLGAAGLDFVRSISLDSLGSPVVAGYTYSLMFPTTSGAYDESFNGGSADGFVSKLDATGSTLIWSTFLGGSGWDNNLSLSLDSTGNPIVTGYTWSSDFPTTPGAYNESLNGWEDVFVTKLDATGSTLMWSTFLGGDGIDEAYGLTLDPSGDPIVTGDTGSSDFPTTPGAYDRSPDGNKDVFISELNAEGSILRWSTLLGGSDLDVGYSIALDPSGDPIVAGYTESPDFPTTSDAYDETYSDSADVFVAKLSATGSDLVWSTYLGDADDEQAYSIALDPSGNPIVAGYTQSFNFPTTPGAYDEIYNGGYEDAFVTKFNVPRVIPPFPRTPSHL